jgi:hypothetical protein
MDSIPKQLWAGNGLPTCVSSYVSCVVLYNQVVSAVFSQLCWWAAYPGCTTIDNLH